MGGSMSLRRLLAVALSLAATAFFMVLFKVAHAPAGATTLLVSMGLITRPLHLLVIEIAVAFLCAQAICFNRWAGLRYPLWAGSVDSAMEELWPGPGSVSTLQERKENLTSKQ